MGDCVKGCVEEDDRSIVYGSSSFMLPGESCMGSDAQLLYSVINKSSAGCLVVVVASGRFVTTTSLDLGKADLSVSEVINFPLDKRRS